jgi:hypothetical protein
LICGGNDEEKRESEERNMEKDAARMIDKQKEELLDNFVLRLEQNIKEERFFTIK